VVSLDSQGFKEVFSIKISPANRWILIKSSLNMVQKRAIFRLVRRIFNVPCVISSEYTNISRKNTYNEFSAIPYLIFIVCAEPEYEIRFSKFRFYHPLPVTKVKYNFSIKKFKMTFYVINMLIKQFCMSKTKKSDFSPIRALFV